MTRKQLLLLLVLMFSLTIAIACSDKDETVADGDVIDGDTTIDGDTVVDGDAADGDVVVVDGDTVVDGDIDTIDGDAEMSEGDTTDGDTADGDTDTVDGDTDLEAETEVVETETDVETDGDTDTETESEIVLELGDTCGNPHVITPADLPYVNASNTILNFNNDLYFAQGDMTCTGYENIGWDKVYSFTANANENIVASMTSVGWDGGLYMLTTCVDGVQVSAGCTGDDTHNADAPEFFTFAAVSGTTYYFVVDFAGAAQMPQNAGLFTFSLVRE